jgi:PKD repeat protein
MKRFLLFTGMIALIAIVLTSCKKDPPVCDFTYVANGLTVTFTSAATNSDTYLWEFGDGETSTEMNPVHKYEGGGDYEVKFTATGEGGSDYKRETITVVVSLADVKDMLTGGSSAANGKTWVLKTEAGNTGDGASAVTNDMPVLIPTPADFFGWIKRELDNEYTFNFNGSYSINPKNDSILAIFIYAALNGLPNTPGNPYGVVKTKYTVPASATWTLSDADFAVDAISDPATTATPPVHGNVNFTDKTWLSFSTGAFLGILDWTTNSHVIIKSISPTEMKVALMVCLYQGVMNPGGMEFAQLPTHIYHLTFIVKP